jgi:hypothetical protein
MHTTEQFLEQTKTVTRRVGWKFLKPGDVLNGCKQCQGLKKGEKVIKLGQIKVVSIKREQLCKITRSDIVKEGFSGLTKWEFIAFFCEYMKVTPQTIVTRIEFEYI